MFILVVYASLAGCAAMKPAYEREFDAFSVAVSSYHTSVSDSTGQNTNSDETYFNELVDISSVRLKSEQIQLVSAERYFCCACVGLQGA